MENLYLVLVFLSVSIRNNKNKKKGRYGPFWACSKYPECKTIVPLKEKAKPEPIGEMCPECGKELVRRKSRFGTTFIGCSNYPKCKYVRKEPKKEK